jgi:asparagine synthase (glutamine-hydrolysing)
MRESFSDILPQAISWRKDKIGYEPPQKSWMENPLFVQRVKASQELLVKEGVLKRKVLDQKVHAGGVGQTRNSSWSHFAAGNLFQ